MAPRKKTDAELAADAARPVPAAGADATAAMPVSEPAGDDAEFVERQMQEKEQRAERETARAEEENRLPTNSAITNPAPASTMEVSGAFIEDEIKDAVPLDHPAVDNNPRRGTSAVQNGQDFNDPYRLNPNDPKFSGQGLDLSVYGVQSAKE